MSLNHISTGTTNPIDVSFANVSLRSCVCSTTASVPTGATAQDYIFTSDSKNVMTMQPPYITPPLYELQRGLLSVINGVSDCYMLNMGDSLKVGDSAADVPNGYVNAYPNTPGVVLGKLMATQYGINVNTDAIIGDRNMFQSPLVNYSLYDTRVTCDAAWNLTQTTNAATGGNVFRNSTTTSAFSYTPTNPFDTVEIYFGTTTGGQVATIAVDGVSVGTINCAGGSGAVEFRTVFSGFALGTHTISITPQTIGGVYVYAIIPKNSTIKQVYFHTIAGSGAFANSWADPSSGLSIFLGLMNQPITFASIAFGTNEALNAITPAAFLTNLQALLQRIQTASTNYITDVIFNTGCRINPVTNLAPALLQNQLTRSIYNCAGMQYPVIDSMDITGSFTRSVALGYCISTNPYHWIKKGYALVASSILTTMISSMASASKFATF